MNVCFAHKQTIDTVSGPDVSDFYKLWAAASAVDTLCIIKGKAGMAVGNGEFMRSLLWFFSRACVLWICFRFPLPSPPNFKLIAYYIQLRFSLYFLLH